MAYLRSGETQEKQYLLTHHTFGRRSEAVDTLIKRPEISKVHAVIEWSGREWQIRDLSRNGTWVGNQKLNPVQNRALKPDDIIHFAGAGQNSWIVEDLTPPSDLLIGLNEKSSTETLCAYHLLPNSDNPMAALFFCNSRERWVLETLYPCTDTDETNCEVLLTPGEVITLGCYKWQLHLISTEPRTADLTRQSTDINQCVFNFEISLDEEHTRLNLQYRGNKADFGERSHHYLLLHLTRLKIQHANTGVDSENQGWIDNNQLARELGIDVSHINIQIFRARKQMAEAFPDLPGLSALIQRRRGAVRFNCPQAKIIKGKHHETLSA